MRAAIGPFATVACRHAALIVAQQAETKDRRDDGRLEYGITLREVVRPCHMQRMRQLGDCQSVSKTRLSVTIFTAGRACGMFEKPILCDTRSL